MVVRRLVRQPRTALALGIHLSLVGFAGLAQAADEPQRFPSFEDGLLVMGNYFDPDASFMPVHVGIERLDEVAAIATERWCRLNFNSKQCDFKEARKRVVDGEPGKRSQHTIVSLVIDVEQYGEYVEDASFELVRSCPDGAVLVADNGQLFENRASPTGDRPVACIPSTLRPGRDELGRPEESGANQCPIGNAPTVGNPINPLTMSKIETVVDYADPAGSGLHLVRTYHSGAYGLQDDWGTVHSVQPEPSPFGAKWRHTWDRRIIHRSYYDVANGVYVNAVALVLEDGREVRFIPRSSAYEPEPGERGRLSARADGGWLYVWPDGTKELYEAEGSLSARTDANGRSITLDHGQIALKTGHTINVLRGIRDWQGRELRLSYDDEGNIQAVDTPDGQHISYEYARVPYDTAADLVKVSYPDGRSVAYLYDEKSNTDASPAHNLTGIIEGDGRRFSSFKYDYKNRAVRSERGNDLEWTEIVLRHNDHVEVVRKGAEIREDWQGVRINGKLRLGERTEYVRGKTISRRFDYLDNGAVARQTDYLGTPTTYRYDPDRQLEVERIEADGKPAARTVKTTWHPRFDKPTRIDTGAQWITFNYDDQGNLTEQRVGGVADAADPSSAPWPEERITQYTYDASGHVLTVDGPLAGNDDTTRYSYREVDAPGCSVDPANCAWRRGDLHTVTSPLGHVMTVLASDGAGRIVASMDANGTRTDRRYDPMGRLVETAVRASRDGTPSADDIVTRATYNANGDLHVSTDPDGATLTHTYDAARRLIERVDALGNRQRIEPNEHGLVGVEAYVRSDGTDDGYRAYAYDARGVLQSLSDRDGYAIQFPADGNGRSLGQTGSTTRTTLRRDARGRVNRVSQGDLITPAQTDLAYDGLDRVKTVIDPKKLSTSYLHNGLGDLLWQRSPDTGETQFEHDANGQPVSETPADQRQIKRGHDLLGRITTLTYSDGKQTTFTYDASPADCGSGADFGKGRLGTVIDRDGGTTHFCHDFAGRIVRKTQVTQGVRLDVHYGYTPAGRLASITYPDGRRVNYTRDAAGRITDVATTQLLVTGIRHDALGRPIGWRAGNRTLEREYDQRGAVTRVSDGRSDGMALQVAYRNGLVDSITHAALTGTVTNSALAFVTAAGSASATPEHPSGNRHTYSYDKTGNRLTWGSLPAISRQFTYATDSHRLLVGHNVSREYDANGNTTRIGEREFVYDASGRMSQAKVNGVAEMNYAYNPFGQQVAKFIAGQVTVSLHDEAGHWLGDYDAAGRPIRQVVWMDDLPMVALDGEVVRDIQADHLGAPRVVIDRATDKAIWHWRLTGDAFGSEAPDEDVDGDGTKYVFDMRFPGQRYDAVTGLFQNGWRDYDPLGGRYVQSDPIGLLGGISTYAYVGNNPYVNIDPYGLWTLGVEAYLGLGGGFNVAWQNGTLEVTGRIGVGFGGGVAIDPNGGPSNHAKSCGSGYIGRTTATATAGIGLGPASAQVAAGRGSENVFDLSPKKHAMDWGSRGYRMDPSPVVGLDGTKLNQFGVRASASIGFEFGSYTNW